MYSESALHMYLTSCRIVTLNIGGSVYSSMGRYFPISTVSSFLFFFSCNQPFAETETGTSRSVWLPRHNQSVLKMFEVCVSYLGSLSFLSG